jgi:tetratricopeptide (TPR) repeat protein
VLRILQITFLAALISPIVSSQDSAGGPTKIQKALVDLDDELRRIDALLKQLSPMLKSGDPASSVQKAEAALNLLTSQEAYQRGRIAEENRQYEAAVDAFSTAIQSDQANDSALLHRAHAFLELGKLDFALGDLNRSLAVQPNNSHAYELRARVHRARKAYGQAIADLEAAARLDPNNAALVLAQAAIAEDRGDIQTAIELYSHALSRSPSSVEIRLKRAAAFTKGNRFEDSLKDCTGAIELEPSSAAGYLCRAEVNLRQRRVQPAIADVDQAMRLNPLALEAGPVISALWREIQLREVAQQASAVTGQAPQPPLTQITAVTTERVPAASIAPERPAPGPGTAPPPPVPATTPPPPVPATTPPPLAPRPAGSDAVQPPAGQAVYYANRGRDRIAQNHYQEAIAELGKAIELDPSCAEAYNARGYAYLREHNYTEAIADFTSAIRLNLKYANAYLNRGVARKLAGDAQGAKSDFQRARVLTPEAAISLKPVKAE